MGHKKNVFHAANLCLSHVMPLEASWALLGDPDHLYHLRVKVATHSWVSALNSWPSWLIVTGVVPKFPWKLHGNTLLPRPLKNNRERKNNYLSKLINFRNVSITMIICFRASSLRKHGEGRQGWTFRRLLPTRMRIPISANFVLVEHFEHVLRARTIPHAKNDVLSISVLPVPNIWFGTKTMSNKSLLSKCCGYCC